MSIDRLWDRISARIEADGGVLHRSSFEQEVQEWMRCAALPGPEEGPERDYLGLAYQTTIDKLISPPTFASHEDWLKAFIVSNKDAMKHGRALVAPEMPRNMTAGEIRAQKKGVAP